jgi:L-fuculose-phosphate aldolase
MAIWARSRSVSSSRGRCAVHALFGSRDLALSAARALDGHTACLLANHGMICYGATLDTAMATAVKLETIARQYWMTLQIGEPILLSDAEMVEVHERYRRGYGTPTRSYAGSTLDRIAHRPDQA